jgi:hypothetical protein
VVIGRDKPPVYRYPYYVEQYKNRTGYVGIDKVALTKKREYDYDELLKCASLK